MSEDRDQALKLLGVARWLEAYPPGLAEALVAGFTSTPCGSEA